MEKNKNYQDFLQVLLKNNFNLIKKKVNQMKFNNKFLLEIKLCNLNLLEKEVVIIMKIKTQIKIKLNSHLE